MSTHFGDDDSAESIRYARVDADEIKLDSRRTEGVDGDGEGGLELREIPVVGLAREVPREGGAGHLERGGGGQSSRRRRTAGDATTHAFDAFLAEPDEPACLYLLLRRNGHAGRGGREGRRRRR